MGNFHLIVIAVGTTIIFLSFFFAFAVRGNHTIPAYLNLFYYYPLLILFESVNSILCIYFHLYSGFTENSIEKLLFLFDFIFWALFFLAVFKSKNPVFKKVIYSNFIIFLLIMLVSSFTFRSPYESLGFSNMGKSIFCLLYVYDLFTSEPNINLKKDPVFWIVCGLFFYAASTIPIYLSLSYLYQHYQAVVGFLFPITNITIIIMHLLFIKGFLCIKQQRIPS